VRCGLNTLQSVRTVDGRRYEFRVLPDDGSVAPGGERAEDG
jgi:hypothetical protein